MSHQHTWKPQSVSGRFVCDCYVQGWVVAGEIVAVKCTRRGCTKEAVTNSRCSRQMCEDHAEGASFAKVGTFMVTAGNVNFRVRNAFVRSPDEAIRYAAERDPRFRFEVCGLIVTAKKVGK